MDSTGFKINNNFKQIDSYLGGMEQPERNWKVGSGFYRYGFNGKENDNEVKGNGNQQDYGMRIYDTRLGRFLSVDPITKSYPWLTPYQFASNRPVDGIDLDGLEFLKAGTAAFVLQPKAYRANAFQFGGDNIYKGKTELVIRNQTAYDISAQHMADASQFASKFSPDKMESDYKPYKRGDVGFRASGWLNNFYGTSADAVSEGIDLCIMLKVYGNMIKETLDPKTKNNIEAANTTWAGIAAANRLVKLAAENPTFPSKLNTKEVLTDLTNYITDGTVNNNPTNYAYSNVIRTWGALIFNNQESTKKGTMNFLPERKTGTTLTGPSSVQIHLIGDIGNSNPDVKKANDLIKDKKVQSSGTQVQSSN